MPVQRFAKGKKKDGRLTGRLDYDRLCALLGRSWPYITPEYFYGEMDLFDIAKLVPFVDPAGYEACWTGRKRPKNRALADAVSDGVVGRT